jgi:Transcriptional regulator
MQIIKEELNALILEKAEKEFLQKGFEHASLRNIAKESNTTIGNIYHYHASKEALFDALVKNEYANFLYLMEHNENPLVPDINPADSAASLRDFFTEYLKKLMPIFTKRFILLIDRSQNTQYAFARTAILTALAQHVDKHFNAYGIITLPGFSRVLGEQLLAGLLFIIETCEETEQKQKLISDMFVFFIDGALHFKK